MIEDAIRFACVLLAASLLSLPVFGDAAELGFAARELTTGVNFRECPDCPEMKIIPPGSFLMGAPPGEAPEYRAANELPQHPVTIERPFAMAIFDVTRSQYAAFVEATKHRSGADCKVFDGHRLADVQGRDWENPGFRQGDQDPAVCVSWDDAKAYVAWLNSRVAATAEARRDGPYRLPTEAEWEYAARAGTTTRYYWGNEIRRDQANYGSETKWAPMVEGGDKWPFTSPGGAFPANGFGLFDMAGNVWQWTEDCWHDDYVGAPADGSAWVSGLCTKRVVRGGAWYKIPFHERSSKRGVILQGERRNEIGFRVVRSLD